MNFRVGESVKEFVGLGDGVHFEWDAAGVLVLVTMRKPTQREVNNMAAGKEMRLGIFERLGQMIMLLRFGDGPWMDAPFCPQLARGMSLPDSIGDGLSIGMTVVLADTADGVVRSIRLASPPTKFARKLVDTARRINATQLDLAKYNADLRMLMDMYQTSAMVSDASYLCRCSFGEGGAQ